MFEQACQFGYYPSCLSAGLLDSANPYSEVVKIMSPSFRCYDFFEPLLIYHMNAFRAMNGKWLPTQLRLRKLTSKFPGRMLDIEIVWSPRMYVGFSAKYFFKDELAILEK